jgi:hypothetical protein
MTLRTPSKSLLIFLALVIAVGALVHHLVDGIGLAAFFLFISSIEGKPAWKWFFDAPGNQDSGRDGARHASWRRLGAQSAHASPRLRQLVSSAWKPSTN